MAQIADGADFGRGQSLRFAHNENVSAASHGRSAPHSLSPVGTVLAAHMASPGLYQAAHQPHPLPAPAGPRPMPYPMPHPAAAPAPMPASGIRFPQHPVNNDPGFGAGHAPIGPMPSPQPIAYPGASQGPTTLPDHVSGGFDPYAGIAQAVAQHLMLAQGNDTF